MEYTTTYRIVTRTYGIYQKESAKKDAKAAEKRKGKFKIPDAHKERMSRMKMREQTDMPGLAAMEEKIGASTAQGLTAYKEMGNQASFGNMIQQSIQKQNRIYADLGIKAAQYKLDRQLDVDKGLGETASYEEKRQDIRRQELDAKIADARTRQQAGEQNIAGGAQLTATSVGGKLTGGEGSRTGGGDNRTETQAQNDWGEIDKEGQDAILKYSRYGKFG